MTVPLAQPYPNPGGPWDPNEFRLGFNRPAARQTPVPRPGDRVLVRVEPFGPLAGAEVLDVEPDDTHDDHYLWHVATEGGLAVRDELGNPLLVRAPDPWPWLLLATDWGRFTIREGRVRGSQGWWPLDWKRRWYPKPGGAGWCRPIDERMPA